MRKYILIACLIFISIFLCDGVGKLDIYNWRYHFPKGSTMGLFLAFAMPLDLPHRNVFMSYNFEANHPLPFNLTSVEYPPLLARGNVIEGNTNINQTVKLIDRKLVYDIIETQMKTYGYPGRSCLLRTICETALHSVTETNGVFGDIFHILFTPSSSKNTGLKQVYIKAEKHGKQHNNCTAYHKNCSTSFLDLVSWISHIDL